MKRRELIKLGSAILGSASIGAVAGYGVNSALNSKTDKSIISDNKLSIKPKQTAKYEFSSPMPFDKKLIDKIDKLNQKMTKGKVTVLYSSLPYPIGNKMHPVLGSTRGINEDIKTLDDYLDYIKYALSKGFRCVYALNTTTPYNLDNKSNSKVLDLFSKLKETGVSAVKLSNPNLISLFHKNMPDFEIQLSTSCEYGSIQNYKNLISIYPTIKAINVATDNNHNFDFLLSLKKLFPDIKVEILVNESRCIKNCPARFYHPAEFVEYPCIDIAKNNPALHMTKSNVVHPWQLDYYSAIGINNFKFTCLPFSRNNITDIYFLKYYLNCVENGVSEFSANDINDKIYKNILLASVLRFKKNCSLAKLIEYLPNMDKLVELGSRCSVDCETNCKYCFDCAKKIEELAKEV